MTLRLLPVLAILLPTLALCACSSPEGSFPGECEDGKDNDNDGQTDCDDADCGGNAACAEGDTDTDTDADSDTDADADADADTDADSDADADADTDADADADSDADTDSITVEDVQRGVVTEGEIVTLDDVIVTTQTSSNGAGFFVQDSGGGAYSGIYVYCGNDPVEVRRGDTLTITGEVTEYYDLTEISVAAASDVVSTGTGMVSTTTLSSIPSDWEPYEGVLLKLQGVSITGEADSFGESSTDFGITLDDMFYSYQHQYGLGDSFTYVIGPLTYTYDAYKIEPRDASDFVR